MPSLLLENLPRELYESLRKRAEARRRPLSEEALLVLEAGLQKEVQPPLREYMPNEEISAPVDLPLPETEEISAPVDLPLPETAVRVRGCHGEPPLPDPICSDMAALSRLPEYVPTEETPAPFDLPRSSRPVSVATYAGSPRLPDVPTLEESEQG